MTTDTLITLFKRDLNILIKEINLYNDASNMWKVEQSVTNSAGTLCLHLIGNLNHFIGAVIGNTGYVRQRELEFSQKDVPRIELIKSIEETIVVIEESLKNMSDADLKQDYKLRVINDNLTTEFFLIHLSTHLAYHLGQINYHRRLLD